MKKCFACGKTHDDSWTLCLNCRNSLDSYNTDKENKTAKDLDSIALFRERNQKRYEKGEKLRKFGIFAFWVAPELFSIKEWAFCNKKEEIVKAIKEWRAIGIEI